MLRLTTDFEMLRLAEDFEMLRLTHDFEILRLTCDFKTLRLMPTRRQTPARRNFLNSGVRCNISKSGSRAISRASQHHSLGRGSAIMLERIRKHYS